MMQSRARVKELRRAIGRGEPDAARELLAHSKAYGHRRLSLRRYLAARFLEAEGLEDFRPYCMESAVGIGAAELLKMARELWPNRRLPPNMHFVVSELLMSDRPYMLPYDGIEPELDGKPLFCGAKAAVLGKVSLGSGYWLGSGSVIRADGHFVQIGSDFRLGNLSTVHIAHGLLPTIVGNRVSVGCNSIVHACTVGDGCVIEDNVVVLDGSVLEPGLVVAANSTVFPRSAMQSGYLYQGSPAKPVRPLESGELVQRALAVQEANAAAALTSDMPPEKMIEPRSGNFIAETAVLSGETLLEDGASIFFGCRFNGAANPISIGRNTNIQDNSVIDATDGPVSIGENTTLGHNVYLHSCRIAPKSLIGMGSLVNVGTTIEQDVLLAAGSVTSPGQTLETGWLWGGRPARPIAKLDDAKRAMMSATIEQYCAYAISFRDLQARKAKQRGNNGKSAIENSYPDW